MRGRKIISILLPLFIFFSGCSAKMIKPEGAVSLSEPLIIDHTCTDIHLIPEGYINKAKAQFRIAYGHTSHGSQIISGMELLAEGNSFYAFGNFGGKNRLRIYDREPKGDLGNPDRRTWEKRTRYSLKGWGDINIVMWSWCGQVSSASEEDIDLYLNLMDQLEKDYPSVVFVYMTGHLDGSGESGNLNIRNNQIREFCLKNNKVLYDFADLESYDPDGKYFLDKGANDLCDYWEGGTKKNWADEWCAANRGLCVEYQCAHSRSLNCYQKGKAFWWMMARLAGWNPAE